MPDEAYGTHEKSEQMLAVAHENFDRWNEALQTGDPKVVAALYHDDATFLPTKSGEFMRGQAGAEKYFTHFLEDRPTGEVVSEEVQSLGTEAYLHSGNYNFSLGPDDARRMVEARFSFVWVIDDQGEWKILHHHSSARPQA